VIEIRKETPDDFPAVRYVNEQAFAVMSKPGSSRCFVRRTRLLFRWWQWIRVVSSDTSCSRHPVAEAPENFRGVGLAPMSVCRNFKPRNRFKTRSRRPGGMQTTRVRRNRCPGTHSYYPRFGFSRQRISPRMNPKRG